jgi:hypothetical protein
MQTQTGSELPGLLICTRPHSNNSQNTHTHNALIFQHKWFTQTRINTSDHIIQILVPYIGLTIQELFHAWPAMRIITDPTTISGVALEVRSLWVHSVIWAANPYPLNAYMHCAHSQCLETQNLEALSPTTYWDTRLRSIDAKLPWNHSRWQPLIQRRTTDLWL